MDCGPTCIAMIAKYYGINEMQLPCILYWNQNHFVVLYEIKKKGIYYQLVKNQLDI